MADIIKLTLKPEGFQISPPTARDKNYRKYVENSVLERKHHDSHE